MAIYNTHRGVLAVGIETTAGDAAALTLDAHTLTPAAPVLPKLTSTPVTRGGLQRGVAGPLHALVGKSAHAFTIPVHDRFVTATIDAGGADAQWDGRGIDALLRSCGWSVTSSGAGSRVYDMRTTTLPSTASSTIEVNLGDRWVQMPGSRGTWTWEVQSGQPALWTFEMMGAFYPPEIDGILGTTPTDDVPAPPNGDSMALTIGSFSTAFVTSCKIAANMVVQPREVARLLERANYSFMVCSDGSSTFVDETTDSNSSSTGDVDLYPSAASGDYFAVGARHAFCGIAFNTSQAAAGTHTLTWQYYNGSTWTTLTTNDGTSSFTVTGKKYVTFTPPSDWARTTVNSVEGFWVRQKITSYSSMGTRPLVTQAWTLYPPNGVHSAEVVDCSGITVDLALELPATATELDPEGDWRSYTARSITIANVPGGTAFSLASCRLAKAPEIIDRNGRVFLNLSYLADHSYGATPCTITKA